MFLTELQAMYAYKYPFVPTFLDTSCRQAIFKNESTEGDFLKNVKSFNTNIGQEILKDEMVIMPPHSKLKQLTRHVERPFATFNLESLGYPKIRALQTGKK